jgi:hypothetical protein
MPPDARDINAPLAAEPPGTEPDPADFIAAIREVAVFAWSLRASTAIDARFELKLLAR